MKYYKTDNCFSVGLPFQAYLQKEVNLGKQLKFSEIVASISLWLDRCLISETSKLMILLELSIPWENCIEEVYESKEICYAKRW